MKRVGRIFGLMMVLFIALSTLTALAASYQNGDRVTVTTDQVWAFHGGRQPGETSSTSNGGNRENHYNNRLYWYEGYSIDILQVKGIYTPQYDGKTFMYCIHKWTDYGNGERDFYTSPDGNIQGSEYWATLGRTKQRLLQLLSIYGFPGQTPQELGVSTIDDAYAATQAIAWEIVTGRRTLNGFTANYKSAGNEDTPQTAAAVDNARYFYEKYMLYPYDGNGHHVGEATPALTAYNKIWADMAKHDVLTSFDEQTLTLNWDAASKAYKGSITDTNGMLANSTLTSTLPSGVSCSINGNTVTFTATKPVMSTSALRFQKNLSTMPQTAPFAVLEAPDGKGQEMMCGMLDDPRWSTLSIRTATGSMRLIKTSADGIVAGMKFRIQGNGIDQTVTTGSNGEISLTLPAGTYTATEIDVPDRYVTPESQSFTIRDGQTTTLRFTNNYKYGELRLIKTSEDGNVAGIRFIVTGPNGYREETVTGSNGEFTLSLLPGTYTVTEQTPEQYNAQQSQTVTITAGQTATVRFTNTLKRGGLKVVKTFEGRTTPLAGVPFTVTGPDGYEKQFTTDANGEIHIDRLLPGKYTVEELESELTEAYLLSPSQTIDVAADKVAELKIYNELKKGYVELYKTDTVNGAAFANAVYGIYDSSGVRIGELITNAQGYAKSGLINYGTGYYLLEEQAPAGWLLDTTKHSFDITENGATITIRAANAPQLGRIEIYKEGEVLTGADFRLTEQGMIYCPIYETQYLPGMTVELYAQEDIIVNGVVIYEAGELVDTQATTADAPAVFDGLYPGSYLYRETIAPDGFFIGANEGVVQLEPGGQEEIVVTATVYNERQKARIVFWKEWEENPVYPNPDVWQDMSFGLFTFEDILDIYGNVAIEAGSLVDVAGIDQYGQGAFTVDLPVGFVGYVQELTTAAGYELDDTQYPVAFEKPGQEIPFVRIDVNDGEAIRNSVIYGDISIIKESDMPEDVIAQGFPNVPLAGAVYGVYSTDGRLILTLAPTDENGYAASEPDCLPYGEYYLQEITPPPFYQQDANKYYFTIGMEQDEEENLILHSHRKVKNAPIIGKVTATYDEDITEGQDYVPDTGENRFPVMSSTALSAVSVAVAIAARKRKKRGETK